MPHAEHIITAKGLNLMLTGSQQQLPTINTTDRARETLELVKTLNEQPPAAAADSKRPSPKIHPLPFTMFANQHSMVGDWTADRGDTVELILAEIEACSCHYATVIYVMLFWICARICISSSWKMTCHDLPGISREKGERDTPSLFRYNGHKHQTCRGPNSCNYLNQPGAPEQTGDQTLDCMGANTKINMPEGDQLVGQHPEMPEQVGGPDDNLNIDGMEDEMGDETVMESNSPLPYHEPQYKQYCQVHSINAYLGGKTIQTVDLMNTAQELNNAANKQGQNLEGIHYNNNTGNFSNYLVNYHLQQTQLDVGYVHPIILTGNTQGTAYPHITERTHQRLALLNCEEDYSNGLEIGSSKEQILARVQPYMNVILHHKAIHSEGFAYGHAVCLQHYQQKWYLIDSERKGPTDLDSLLEEEGWGLVYGKVFTLQNRPPLLGPLSLTRPTREHMDLVSPIKKWSSSSQAENSQARVNTNEQDWERETSEPPPRYDTAGWGKRQPKTKKKNDVARRIGPGGSAPNT